MKRKILFISFIVIFCNLFAQQKLSRFQWQFKKLTQDSEYGDVYEIYLFDNTTDETTYLLTLQNNMKPSVRNDISIEYKNMKSISNISSWWAGGGIGCSVFYKDGWMYIYRAYYEERTVPFIAPDEIELFKIKCLKEDCIINEFKIIND